jgi:hypothetical protein
MGQSLGTGPDGGHDHHILHADNEVTSVWGNDRELMTFDDAGGAYFGRVASVAGATLTTADDTRCSTDATTGGWAGGTIAILNRTGAGQDTPVVVPGIGPEPTNPRNRTWVMDRPFRMAPDASSWIQITPFRGRNLFVGDLWQDGGAVQYYGTALDNVIADATFSRMTGVLAWGQWRGWVPPNRSLDDGGAAAGKAAGAMPGPSAPLRGQMGNGLMPNLRNQYLRNTFEGSWSFPNYNYTGSSSLAFYARRFFAVQPLTAPEGISGSFLLVYRNNSGGAGYNFGQGATNIVVDGGAFSLDGGTAKDGGCVLQGASTSLIYTQGISCATAT